jgi:putative transposase
VPGPAPASIDATPRQRRVLEQLIRRHTRPQHQVRRARVVLAAVAGASNAAAGRPVGMKADTARVWRRRWSLAREALLAAEAEGGPDDDRALEAVVAGVLADEPRSGAPPTFTPEQLCQLMAIACEPPGDSGRPIGQWTPRELADEAIKRGIVERISARTVGRFLVSGSGRAQASPEPVLAHAPRRGPGRVRRAGADRL